MSTYRDLIPVEKCARCGYCEIKSSLHVHHIDRNRSNNDISNLIVLCANCHLGLHYGMWNINTLNYEIMKAQDIETKKKIYKNTNRYYFNELYIIIAKINRGEAIETFIHQINIIFEHLKSINNNCWSFKLFKDAFIDATKMAFEYRKEYVDNGLLGTQIRMKKDAYDVVKRMMSRGNLNFSIGEFQYNDVFRHHVLNSELNDIKKQLTALEMLR
jgi:hypothetical protein